MDVLKLLKSKNRCLKKFAQVSQTRLPIFLAGDFSELEAMQSQRDAILKAIELFDRKIAEDASRSDAMKATRLDTETFVREARTLLDEQAEIVAHISKIDEKLIELINLEQDRIAGEMTSAQKGMESVQKFKSTWVGDAGASLDRKL